jgi:glycosyltransferase involved in cell wall biosynthesis
MNIFFVTPYVPDPIRVRPYELIRALSKCGHRVTLFTVRDSGEETPASQALRDLGVHVVDAHLPAWRSRSNALRAIASSEPLQAAYCWHPELATRLSQAVMDESPDVIHVEHLRAARYGLAARRQVRTTDVSLGAAGSGLIPVIWDSVDCISHLFEQAARQSRSLRGRLLTRLDLRRTRRYEGLLVNQFDRVLVTSITDKIALDGLAEANKLNVHDALDETDERQTADHVTVLPNGVDAEHFRPNATDRQPNGVVFTGKMSYHANVTAAIRLVEEIMPYVWDRRPDAEVRIVGKDPAPEVQKLASAANGTGRGRVVVTGTVPDMAPYLQQAAVAVAPVPYGAGIQNKVLEAMACGTPVVASPQAVSALKAADGEDLLVADDDGDFAVQIRRLLDGPTLRRTLGEAGRRYVVYHHSWHSIAAQLEDIYAQSIIQARTGDSKHLRI